MGLNNLVHLEGRLTADPVTKAVGENTVCNFSVALDKYMGKDKEKKTLFVNCVAWNHSANFLSKYAHKGDMVTLNGELDIDEYEKDSKKVIVYKIKVDEIKSFSTSAGDRTVTPNTPTPKAKPAPSTGKAALEQEENDDTRPLLDISSEDLPF